MRARTPVPDQSLLCAQFEAALGIDWLRDASADFSQANRETVDAVLAEAIKFSDRYLEDLNLAMDQTGASLAGSRVKTATGHRAAWDAFVAGGWPTLDHPRSIGGQGLPLSLALAVQEVFDRACPAFGMLPVPQRSAARLIAAFGCDAMKEEWLGGLATGVIGATICISEAGAGSDVMQLRTRATREEGGAWRITGEKCWISYGDQDLTDRLVHCVLARTDDGKQSRPEVSLFLVEGGSQQPDRVIVRRLEEKLGLHGSPTCAIGFENARAVLLGDVGRGLAQMFVMITQMRLAVGAMGLAISSAAADVAFAYTAERRQGGQPGSPVTIDNHPDVRRQLLEMDAKTHLLRSLILTTANVADRAAHEVDPDACAINEALVQYLLPIVKTAGADAAFLNASGAIQALGGAGYTREWPVEQMLRDARVLSVFEGTSGIQALDLVQRRVLRDDRGFAEFITVARQAAGDSPLRDCLDRLEDAAAYLKAQSGCAGSVEASASAFMDLAILAALGWMAARFAGLSDDSAAHRRMRTAGRYWLARIDGRSSALYGELLSGASSVALFDEY